jgi:hypothetical protein
MGFKRGQIENGFYQGLGGQRQEPGQRLVGSLNEIFVAKTPGKQNLSWPGKYRFDIFGRTEYDF